MLLSLFHSRRTLEQNEILGILHEKQDVDDANLLIIPPEPGEVSDEYGGDEGELCMDLDQFSHRVLISQVEIERRPASSDERKKMRRPYKLISTRGCLILPSHMHGASTQCPVGARTI